MENWLLRPPNQLSSCVLLGLNHFCCVSLLNPQSYMFLYTSSKIFNRLRNLLNPFQCSLKLYKVSRPFMVTFFNRTALWSGCVVRWGSKYAHQKDMCLEIGQRAQNLLTILGSIVNIIGGIYVTS